MKKAALLITLALGCVGVFAQKPNKSELKQLQSFLAQPAEKDGTNADVLKISDLKDPSTWEGVTMENGRITSINWKDKHLAGNLDLSGFTALQKVDVSRNRLNSVSVNGATALTDFNASRNRLTSVSLNGVTSMTKCSVNNNRLSDIDLTGATAIKSLNCSNNYFVEPQPRRIYHS